MSDTAEMIKCAGGVVCTRCTVFSEASHPPHTKDDCIQALGFALNDLLSRMSVVELNMRFDYGGHPLARKL